MTTQRASVPPPRTRSAGERSHAASRSQLQMATTAGGNDAGPALAPDPLIGLVVAERYRILDLLGRGGMGVVYRVEHVRIGKLLAMKLLAGELSRNPEAVRRFKHEAETASRLSSPNTVQVFDFGAADGLTYLVMELISGDDLGSTLRLEDSISSARLCRMILQVANSLAEAHQHGIVHRDVKPENVMLVKGKEGQEVVKVFDFGLAKLRQAAEVPAMTTPGLIMGTPYFMAPEQVRGEPVDARTDIYALGAVMYRALTGRYAFDGPSPIAVCAKHLTEMPSPPSTIAPKLDIPQQLSDVVMRALAKDPEERFQRVEDLQAAVADVLAVIEGKPVAPFDSAAIRAMTEAGPGIVEHGAEPGAVATRDEVEAYERSLRRKRWGFYAAAMLAPIGALAAGAAWWTRPVETFDGWEREPNEDAMQANPVPFGTTVRGHLGKRVSPTKSDVDLYAFEVPPQTPATQVALRTLPNIPLCLQLFRRGQPAAFAQYCTGQPGVDLTLRALAMEPGAYLAAVLQDLDARGGPQRAFVHENLSDTYELTIQAAADVAGQEVEANDALTAATRVRAGATVAGALASAGDEDFVCVEGGQSKALRVVITDASRPHGVVLEVTPWIDGSARALRRLHTRELASPPKGDDPIDVRSPWVLPLPAAEARCLSFRLGFDPAMPAAARAAKLGSPEPWRVQIEEVP